MIFLLPGKVGNVLGGGDLKRQEIVGVRNREDCGDEGGEEIPPLSTHDLRSWKTLKQGSAGQVGSLMPHREGGEEIGREIGSTLWGRLGSRLICLRHQVRVGQAYQSVKKGDEEG